MKQTDHAKAGAKPDSVHLAPREAEILGLLAEGKPSKVIAYDLSLSPETVRYYIKRIYRALGVNNRAQAVASALRDPRLTSQGKPTTAEDLPVLKPIEFVGRETELADILRATDAHRLVTATGIGGNGKTTLARAAYEAIRAQRPSAWVSLKGVSADDLVHRLSEAAGIELRQTGESGWKEFCTKIAGSDLFLVLDNFEHLVEKRRHLSEILSCAPVLNILATSRIPISLEEELVYPVRGLSLTDKGKAGPSKAADLFLQHLSTQQLDTGFDMDEHGTIHEICARLGGSPLAIKLAASWGDVLKPKQIMQALEENGSLLVGPIETARQEGVRDILKATIALRNEAEQRELQRLACFSGTFSLDIARQVAGSDARSLATFVRSALVQTVSSSNDVFALHPLVAELLTVELQASDQAEAIAKSHAQFFLNRLIVMGQSLSELGTGGSEGLADASVEDVKRAWLWACEQKDFTRLEPAFDPFAAWMVWSKRGVEAIALFDAALRGISAVPDPTERRRIELELRLAYGVVLMSCKGQAAVENGENFMAALALSDPDQAPIQRHRALFGLSRYEMMREQYQASRAHAVECFELAHKIESKSALIEAGTLLGGIDVFCGRTEEAKNPLMQAANTYSLTDSLPLRTRFGQDIGVLANSYLSWVDWQLGQEAAALRTLRKAKRIAEELDDPIAVAWYCTYASALHLLRLDFEQSLSLSEQGRAIARDFDLTLLRVSLEGQIGWSRAMVGDVQAGRDFFHDTLRERKRLGMRSADNWVALGVAMVDHRAGNHDLALDTIDERVDLSAATGSTWMISELTRIKGDILRDQGNLQGAASAYRRALDISDADKTLAFSTRSLLALGTLAIETGEFDPVRPQIEQRLRQDLETVDTKEIVKLHSLIS